MTEQRAASLMTPFYRDSVQSLSQLLEVVAAQPASAAQGSLVRGLIRDISILSRPQASTQELEEIRDRTLSLPNVLRQAGPTCFPPIRQAALETGETLGRYVNARSLANAKALLSRGEKDEVLRSLMWLATATLPADIQSLKTLLDVVFDDSDLENLRRHGESRLTLIEAQEGEQAASRPPVVLQESAQPTKRYFIASRDGAPLGERQRAEVRDAILSLGMSTRMSVLASELNVEGRFAVVRLPEQLQQLAAEKWSDLKFEEDIRLSAQQAERRELRIKLTDEQTGAFIPGIPVIVLTSGVNAGAKSLRFDHRGLLVTPVIGSAGVRVEISPEHSFWSHCLEWPDSIPEEEVEVRLARFSVPDGSWWRKEIADTGGWAGEGVHIALIDTGVAPHRDLNLHSGRTVPGLGALRWDEDDVGHGTFCAGIINGQGFDGGVRGIAPRAALWGIRASDKTTGMEFYLSNIVDGIYEAVDDLQVDLINMSLGGPVESAALEHAVHHAWERGSLVVAAAGNGAQLGAYYPARFETALGVSAYGRRDTYPARSKHSQTETQWVSEPPEIFAAGFSNYGPGVDLCAPGVAICSTYPGDHYRVDDGTSFAAPFVTGCAARLLGSKKRLLKAERNAERTRRIRELVLRHARLIKGLPEGRQGHGRFC